MKKLIEVKNVVKTFDSTVVLKGISLDIYENEFVTLLGPSGCGKTTLLRIIAGFLDATEGQVMMDGEDIAKIPAYKRDVNTVFQHYALFPHLDVYDNIAFGLKIKKQAKDIIDQKVMRMISLVGLEGFEHRDVTSMSGGQQQRVAIARALVNEPRVLLLDESLSALDKNLRKEMQLELKEIQREVGITFIFVTHDQEEALTMSDKIVIMKDGEIEQIGTPVQVYNEPVNEYCARFIGDSNIIDGTMIKDRLVRFDDVDYECVDYGFDKDEAVDIMIRPEDIDIVPRNRGLLNGEVKSVLFKGVHYEVIAETASGTSKTVTMHITKNQDVSNEEAGEKISASSFYMDLEDVSSLTDSEVIARANAQAWNKDDEFVDMTGEPIDNTIYVNSLSELDEYTDKGIYRVCVTTITAMARIFNWYTLVIERSVASRWRQVTITQTLSNRSGYQFRKKTNTQTWGEWEEFIFVSKAELQEVYDLACAGL